VQRQGPVRDSVGAYRRWIEEFEERALAGAQVDGSTRLVKAEMAGPDEKGCRTQEAAEFRTIIDSPSQGTGTMYLGVSEGPATPIFVLRREFSMASGETEARCSIPRLPLPRGRFYVWVAILDGGGRELLRWQPAVHFDVLGPDLDPAPQGIVRLAPVQVEASWEVSAR
jgi:hypothetical protein